MTGGMLDLEVTRRCNLRCDYCFVGWSRDWVSDLPRQTAFDIVDDGAGAFEVLHLTGGEPMAWSHLFDLVEHALGRGYRRVMINTNGTMITGEKLERLRRFAGRLSLSVSLDGPEPIHDRVRGAGRFRQSLECLERLHAAGIDAHVMTVVTPEVLAVLHHFLRQLYEALPQLRDVTLFPVGVGPKHTQKPGAALRPLDIEEVRRMCLVVALSERIGMPVSIGAWPIANPVLLALGYPPERLYQCTAGRGRVCVHANLDVSTCHPVKDPVYGRYRPGLLRELGAFPEHRRFAERDYDGCRSCEHNALCGNCRAFVTAGGHDLFGNDGVCHDVLDRGGDAPMARPARRHLPVLRGAA